MKLLLSQKNDFFDLITNHKEVSPIEFQYLEKNERDGDSYLDYFLIKHKNSDFYFQVNFNHSSYSRFEITHTPDFMSLYGRTNCQNFDEIYGYFNSWLLYLLRELKQVDQWERLEAEFNRFGFRGEMDTNKFSSNEINDIRSKLLTLGEKLKLLELNSLQLDSIQQKIDGLSIQLDSLNRFDWKSLFIGTFISVVLQLSLSQEQGHALIKVIKEVFSRYLLV